MKHIVITIGVALLASACATRPDVTPYDRIRDMRPDCTNAQAQIQWLNTQLEMSGYDPERSEYERRYVATAKELIWTLRSQCWRSVSSFKQFPQ